MSLSLTGKVAFVTGGSRGIGAAIVRRLAADGAAVAFTYAASADEANKVASEVTATGGKALAIKADNTNADEIKAAVSRTVAELGGLDILVNNAGIVLGGPVDEFALDTFDKMFALNVRGTFVAIQAAVPHMKEGGRIINNSSVVAHYTAFPGSFAYAMTKGAVSSMTRAIARDLGPRGLTINAIEPGPTETDNIRNDAMRDMLRPRMALGRLGSDTEVASFVAYLASPESSFITGSLLTIDGGYSA